MLHGIGLISDHELIGSKRHKVFEIQTILDAMYHISCCMLGQKII